MIHILNFRLTEDLPRIQIHTIETADSCTHEVAIPPNSEFTPLDPRTKDPAKTYPFTLDPFQTEAILCIDNNQSVLVSAHTSAGIIIGYKIIMNTLLCNGVMDREYVSSGAFYMPM